MDNRRRAADIQRIVDCMPTAQISHLPDMQWIHPL